MESAQTLRDEIPHLAGGRRRAGRPAAARGLFGDRRRRAARRRSTRSSISSTRIITRSKRSCARSVPTCTCRASSCATTCSTPRANARPNIGSGWPHTARRNRITLAELLAIATAAWRGRQPHPEPRSKARRLLGGLRAALRLDDRREDQSQRRRSCGAKCCRAATPCWRSRRRSKGSTTPTSPRSAPKSRGSRRRFRDELYTLLWRSAPARPAARRAGGHPSARDRAALGRAEGARAGRRAADARAVAAARRRAGRRAPQAVARAARSRRPDAHGAAHGAGPDRSPALRGRRASGVGGRRMPSARRRHGRTSSAISRSACGRACSTTSACSRRSSGRRATSRAAATSRSTLTHDRRARHADRPAPHLRLPRRAGSADQLRAPRAGRAASASTCARATNALDVSVSDDGVGLDPRRRAGGFGLRGIEERVRELGGTRHARERDRPRRDARHPPAAAVTWRRRLRVLLADDHGIVRRGLRSLIETATRLQGRRRGRRRARGAAAVRRASARHADPRHRDAEAERHRGRRARAEAAARRRT